MRRWDLFTAGAKYLFATAVVTGAFVAAAGDGRADGMAPRAAQTAQLASPTWSGVYFGTQSGWAWADIQSDFVPANIGSDSVDHDASTIGAQMGLQHQWGNVVLGIEAGISVAYQDNFANVACPNAARTCGKRFDDVLTIGPRLGWAMGKYMPYLTAGYANAAFSPESYDTATHGNILLGRERFGGWYIGGGVDMAVLAGWNVGLEYRHYEFEDKTFLTHSPAGVLSADVRTVDPSLDTITLRVSWKFDRPDRVAPPLK